MKKKFQLKNGSTMVEVIVAFTVLLICIAMVTTCIVLAGNVQNHEVEHRNNIAQLEEDLYSGNVTYAPGSSASKWTFRGGKLIFSVDVNTKRATAGEYSFTVVEEAAD